MTEHRASIRVRPRRPVLEPVSRNVVMLETLSGGGVVISRRNSRTGEVEPVRAVTNIEELFEDIREAFA